MNIIDKEKQIPDEFKTLMSFVFPDFDINAKQSPPIPVMCGSAKHKTIDIAIATSTALAPSFNKSNPN